jgi:large subunit ribosomal protein L31
MKKNIHPRYDWVVIEDASSDFRILTRSTQRSEQTTKWTDGKEYPLITVEVSSASHPFYTGKQKVMDTAGRIERFQKKYAKAGKA